MDSLSEHQARYKNTGLGTKELRRRREQDSVQLRKQKRDDILSKRRTIVAPLSSSINEDDDSDDETNENLADTSENGQFTITSEMIEGLMQDEDPKLLIEVARKTRKILSKEPQPPFDEVIQAGLMPRFVQLLDRSDDTMIQFEVAWILTNICSGTSEQTKVVVDHGAVPKLVNLLRSSDMKVCEQAVWALGNIIGDGASFRDLVIDHGFVPALLALIRPDIDIGFLRNETWVLVNLCRNKDPPTSLDVISQLLPALKYLIQSTDLAILIDTTWAISYITELGPAYSQLVIDSGLVSLMTPLLTNPEIKIQTAAIRALGSIVTGSEEQTQAIIDAGALPHLKHLLQENNYRVVKEALWFISNITAGSESQVQAVIDNQIIPLILEYLDKGDSPQQKEALWIIYNLCLGGTRDHLRYLYRLGIIRPLCGILKLSDNDMVRNSLESISQIINACHEEYPEILVDIEACEGLDNLEALQQHESTDIYNLALNIIETYFNPTDD